MPDITEVSDKDHWLHDIRICFRLKLGRDSDIIEWIQTSDWCTDNYVGYFGRYSRTIRAVIRRVMELDPDFLHSGEE